MSPPATGVDSNCLALDIGGTKIEAAVVSAASGILARSRIDTDSRDPTLFEQVIKLVSSVRSGYDVGVMGVGCGGPMSRGGERVSPLNIPAWRSFALRQRLVEDTKLPVFIDNDAKALALAEGQFGGARGCDNYLSMVVSTGIGGGLVIDGRLLDGRDGNAGHIGHVIVEPSGRRCECGSIGCLEAEASGTAIAAITGAPPREAPLEIRRRSGALVGRAVASAAALLDFDHCFVAGSVALGFGPTFFDAANEEVARVACIDHVRTLRIEPSMLGADGPVLGAAAVGWRGLCS